MRIEYKISLAASFIFMLFYALPWISLAGEEQLFRPIIPRDERRMRLLFLAFSVFFTSLIFFQYAFFWRRRFLHLKPNWINYSLQVLGLIALAFVISLCLTRISVQWFQFQRSFFAFFIFRNLLIATVAWLIVYVWEIMKRSEQDSLNLLILKNEKIAAELGMLKSQIDPHFLFNSLSSLTGLIKENPDEAVVFVNNLSETFRYILDHSKSNLVSLHQELKFLKSYLYMLEVRFRNAIDVKINIDEVYLSKNVPQFALQLLVENAIKHNIISERHPLQIRIFSMDEVLIVKNSLHFKNPVSSGHGIGLGYLSKQYEITGGKPIEISKSENEFIVELPLL